MVLYALFVSLRASAVTLLKQTVSAHEKAYGEVYVRVSATYRKTNNMESTYEEHEKFKLYQK